MLERVGYSATRLIVRSLTTLRCLAYEDINSAISSRGADPSIANGLLVASLGQNSSAVVMMFSRGFGPCFSILKPGCTTSRLHGNGSLVQGLEMRLRYAGSLLSGFFAEASVSMMTLSFPSPFSTFLRSFWSSSWDCVILGSAGNSLTFMVKGCSPDRTRIA